MNYNHKIVKKEKMTEISPLLQKKVLTMGHIMS